MMLAVISFALSILGLFALYAHLSQTKQERVAFAGLVGLPPLDIKVLQISATSVGGLAQIAVGVSLRRAVAIEK
jgi:uncharacterized membrane protein